MATPKQYPVCAECGSDDVVIDAWAEWDVDQQKWVLSDTFDEEVCRDCEGGTSFDWKEV